ncbi:XerC Integrase [Burkholderiaceae bacterium]
MLTETEIKRMPDPEKNDLVLDDRGLYLRVTPTGSKTWVYRTKKGGSTRVITIGKWPRVSLNAARLKAEDLRQDALPEHMTFARLLDKWYADRVETKYKTPESQIVYCTYAKQQLGSTAVLSLTTPKLVQALQAYAKTAPVAANRCLGAWKLCLDYAVELGLRDDNPLARVTIRSVGGTEREKDRVLTDAEIKQFWNAKDLGHKGILQFILLTGCRIGEVRNGYFDGDEWVIEEKHSKNKRAHRIHLTKLAQTVYETHCYTDDAVTIALRNWRFKHGITDAWTPHDLRRTFATRIAGIPNMGLHIVEKLLNHKLQGVLSVYNKHDYEPERKAALETWSKMVKGIVNAK